tara:strand:+ start:2101 stop:2346 length:246 start_codon:yes stop_codon:yes gene_type:complete
MNEHWDAWYQATQLIHNIPVDPLTSHDGLYSPATTGTLVLSASYAVAGGLMFTRNPYAMATAGVILAIPDPVIFGIGMLLA